MESFPIVLDVLERLPDVIDGSPVTQTASLRTDGVYCWRDDLSHYVRRHRVSLPAEFVARVGQAHPPMTARELERAAREVLALWSDLRVIEIHETGFSGPPETATFVVWDQMTAWFE